MLVMAVVMVIMLAMLLLLSFCEIVGGDQRGIDRTRRAVGGGQTVTKGQKDWSDEFPSFY